MLPVLSRYEDDGDFGSFRLVGSLKQRFDSGIVGRGVAFSRLLFPDHIPDQHAQKADREKRN